MTTKEDDFVEHIITSSTHDNILFFSNRGRVYKLKAYQIPEAGRTAKGMNLINLLPLEKDEKIQNVIYLKEFKQDRYLIMGTKNGLIKKTSLDQYSSIRKNGLNAINLRENDELISVRVTTGECNIIYATKNGYAIKFDEKDRKSVV